MQQQTLKIIPLGGNGEVTKNMYVYEYGNDQLIVDCGMGFPKAGMLGVDILIPDVSYLEKSAKNIRGIVLTHGHEDHIGGLPYILPRLPKNLPVYGSTLTIAFAENKVREYGLNNPFHVAETNLNLGPFKIDLIHITHSIPNCKHLLIKTPAGTVYHGADFKFDLNPPDGKPPAIQQIAQAGINGVDLLVSDCLGVEKSGFTAPERDIETIFEQELQKTKGKFIVTAISSSVSRLGMAINVAAKHGRKVAILGRSVDRNLSTAAKLGFITFPKNTMIRSTQIKNFKDSQLALIVAGSQGQEGSAMQRAAAGEHNNVQFKAGDRVVISSDIIPGGESNVNGLINTLAKKDIDVSYGTSNQLHVSGHGHRGELELLVRLLNPKNFFPVGGEVRHQKGYRHMVGMMGYQEDRAFIPNDGQSLLVSGGKVKLGPTVELKNIYVDGLGIGDVGKVVLRDRQVMSQDGILIVIVPIRHDTSKISGDLEVISRGFVYAKESQELLDEIKDKVTQALKGQQGIVTDWNFLRTKISDTLEKFIYYKTERNPLILPVIVEV